MDRSRFQTDQQPWKVGLISDTHGLLRPEAVATLEHSDLILHAGDIGKPEVLQQLNEIAPLIAIRGNVDWGYEWSKDIPDCENVCVGQHNVYILHDVNQLDFAPQKQDVRIIVSGHSHEPKIEERDGILYVNPGSAGPRRFQLPIAVGHLEIRDGEVRAEIETLG